MQEILTEWAARVAGFDWFYAMSDDHSVWLGGTKAEKEMREKFSSQSFTEEQREQILSIIRERHDEWADEYNVKRLLMFNNRIDANSLAGLAPYWEDKTNDLRKSIITNFVKYT